MIVNIIAITVIVLWAAFVLYSVLKSKINQKKSGLPSGCYSCSAYKTGMCKHNCKAQK
jgi:hypothetical protein